jgi:hypothetical protein
MSSFFSIPKSYDTKHLYKTVIDIKDMTPEEILEIEPDQIRSDILDQKGPIGNRLTELQKKAVYRILAIKKHEKETPSLARQRRKIIDDFKIQNSLVSSPEIDSIINSSTQEVNFESVSNKIINNDPLTEEDQLILRQMNLMLDKLPPNQNIAIRMYNLKQRKGGKYKTRKNRKYKTKRRLYKKSKTNKRKSIKSRRSLRK